MSNGKVRLTEFSDAQIMAYDRFATWLKYLPPKRFAEYVEKLASMETIPTEVDRWLLAEIATRLQDIRYVDTISEIVWWTERLGYLRGKLGVLVRWHMHNQEYMKARVSALWLVVIEEINARLGEMLRKMMWR